MHETESEVAQSCPTLRDPMDRSLPGSSVHGIFQARVLGWGALAFSKISINSVKYVYLPIHTYILSHRMSLDSKTATHNLFNLKQVT